MFKNYTYKHLTFQIAPKWSYKITTIKVLVNLDTRAYSEILPCNETKMLWTELASMNKNEATHWYKHSFKD